MSHSNPSPTLDPRQLLWAALIIIFLLLLTGCGSHRSLPVAATSDSTRVELRTEVKWQRDTVYLSLPAQAAERTTTADSSTLNTDYAESTAVILPDGTLYHWLQSKATDVPLTVDIPVTTRDSIIYRDRVQTETVTIERKLSWWQRFAIRGFWALVALIILAISCVFSYSCYKGYLKNRLTIS